MHYFYHYINANYGRDFEADIITDIALAEAESPCCECGSPLQSFRGVEIGNIFQLGTRYSEAMNCSYLDAGGIGKPVYMGSYGIGLGRLLACIAEQHHDESGFIWPVSVAPFDVHLVDLCKDSHQADSIYLELSSEGIEVLIDDRKERAGVKFNDADLIGIPARITVGEKSLSQGGVEIRIRRSGHAEIVRLAEIVSRVQSSLGDLSSQEAELETD